MDHHQFPIIFVILLSLHPVFSTTNTTTGTIAVNYGRVADNLPHPTEVVQLLKAHHITKVKIYDTDSSVLSALSGSGISVTVDLPNQDLPAAAAPNSPFADTWVQTNILPHKTSIESIAVGNEVPADLAPYLVPAMTNIHAALLKHGVASTIKVSSPLALTALQTSFPSSSGSFKPDLIEPVMKPMLKFLNQTNSYLMINVYPFFAYSANTDTITLDYALFNNNTGNKDPNNGLLYKSLFDAQIDAVYAATAALGFPNTKLVVTETGWPSKGGEGEIGASLDNAAAYNQNLVRRVLTGGGTPLKPDEPLTVYLFALFNENKKTGPDSERNYGLFYPNKEKVYDIPFTAEDLAASHEHDEERTQVPVSSGQTWCVANEKAGEEKLQEALNYACGEGGADCSMIQAGATCYEPNTLVNHASYAFNSYYVKNSKKAGTCSFGGAAYVVTQPPRFGSCEFPTGN